ncbi:hypothetical protein [Faecalimicrobium dakarense]|uniref:hypothetical protein n=1 Tax=Faecalimicrobium dakarense TaxID=1301100 RepID=UPI000694FA91|nr:hypothetical protein [[Clostridium] dakarense]
MDFEKQSSSNDMLIGIMSGVFNCATENDLEVVLYLYSESMMKKKVIYNFAVKEGLAVLYFVV